MATKRGGTRAPAPSYSHGGEGRWPPGGGAQGLGHRTTLMGGRGGVHGGNLGGGAQGFRHRAKTMGERGGVQGGWDKRAPAPSYSHGGEVRCAWWKPRGMAQGLRHRATLMGGRGGEHGGHLGGGHKGSGTELLSWWGGEVCMVAT